MNRAEGWENSDGGRTTFDLNADTTLPADRFHRGTVCEACTRAAANVYPPQVAWLARILHPTRRPHR